MCLGTEAFTCYDSHTSQHAEGSGHSIARFNTGKRVVIIHTILRFTQQNPLNGKLAVSSTSWKEIVEFVETLELEIIPIKDRNLVVMIQRLVDVSVFMSNRHDLDIKPHLSEYSEGILHSPEAIYFCSIFLCCVVPIIDTTSMILLVSYYKSCSKVLIKLFHI
jgi:hypothetical protein